MSSSPFSSFPLPARPSPSHPPPHPSSPLPSRFLSSPARDHPPPPPPTPSSPPATFCPAEHAPRSKDRQGIIGKWALFLHGKNGKMGCHNLNNSGFQFLGINASKCTRNFPEQKRSNCSACWRMLQGPPDAGLRCHPSSCSTLTPAPVISHAGPCTVRNRLRPSPHRLASPSPRIDRSFERPPCVRFEFLCKSLGIRATFINIDVNIYIYIRIRNISKSHQRMQYSASG